MNIVSRLRSFTKTLLLITMAAAGALHAAAQGYVNLNFEDAGTNTIDPNALFLAWTIGAPGWSHAGVASPFIGHTTMDTSGTANYFLVDSNCPSLSPIMGSYSLALINGHLSPTDPNSQFVMTWIAQLGTVPENAVSFELEADGAPFSVTFNGTEIPMVNLGGDFYGGSVSQFEGQDIPLLIQNDSTEAGSVLELDDMFFSSSPVPEPGTLALMACGLGALGAAAWRRRSR